MNVYDFDGTIYDGDSTLDFYRYELKRHPMLIRYLFFQVTGIISYKIGAISKEKMKEQFYVFLRGIHDIDDEIISFWRSHIKKIQPWYLHQKMATDLIISASPYFLLQPICKDLKVNLLASIVDKKTGKYTGHNCYGEEKVIRYRNMYNDIPIENFYSDSDTDLPLAKLAKKSFKVQAGKVVYWNTSNE